MPKTNFETHHAPEPEPVLLQNLNTSFISKKQRNEQKLIVEEILKQNDIKLDSLANTSINEDLQWDSTGTVSEADENDLTLLINGSENNLFDSIKAKNREKAAHDHSKGQPRFAKFKKSPPGLKKSSDKKISLKPLINLNGFQNEFA